MLRVAITKLYGPPASSDTGEEVAAPQQFTDCQVEIPYANDARTARVTISIFDEAAKEVSPLDRMLKIWYQFDDGGHRASRLVFWGPITVPEWNMNDGTLTINAIGPDLRLMHQYINHSDTTILAPSSAGGTQHEGSVTTDGQGMRALRDTALEQTVFPTLGIVNGYNTNPTAPLMNDGNPRNMKVVRGDESYQKMKDLSQDLYAPDFEIEPWDGVGDFPGATGTVDDGSGPHTLPGVGTVNIPIFVNNRHNVGRMRMSFYLRYLYEFGLTVKLRHPDGTEVTLTSGGTGGSREGWGIDATHRLFVADDAPWDFSSSSAQSPYIVGSIASEEPFTRFRNKLAYGTWTLVIVGATSGGGGTLHNFALLFEGRGNRIAGQYARMHTWNKDDNDALASVWSNQRVGYKGPPDKRTTVVFQYGFGADNVESCTYSPGGDRVLNYYVAVTEAGDDARPQHRAIRQAYDSRVQYGTYMGWKAVGRDLANQATGPADVLHGVAISNVAAYGTPPQFVTFTPKRDADPASYLYIRDFWPGDTVTLQIKKGALTKALDVFITKVTLKQLDAAGETQSEVEAVPAASFTAADPGDLP